MLKRWMGGLALFCACAIAVPAQAALVTLSASATELAVGDRFSVDVRISGMDPGVAIAAYDLDLVFDPALLSVSEAQFADSLGLAGVEQFGDALISAGRIDFAAVSLLDAASLLALQGDDFMLVRLVFDARAPGQAGLGFDPAGTGLFADALGNALLLDQGAALSLRIQGGQAVPEPGSAALALLALALLLPAATRRRPR